MTSRTILQLFEKYQKERVSFVGALAELAKSPQNVEILKEAGTLSVLHPLLLDHVPSVQHAAALALGRLANNSEELAETIVKMDVLRHLTQSLTNENRHCKQAAANCLRSIAKHNLGLAEKVFESGCLKGLIHGLEDFDPLVRESAGWAAGSIATHSPELAQQVMDAGAIPLLVLCAQEPELTLKRAAASTLGDIAKHTPDLAQAVLDAGAMQHVAPLVLNADCKLKQKSCAFLANIAKHSIQHAEAVVAAEVFPRLLTCLKFPDDQVKKSAAMVIRDIVKHSKELAQLVTDCGTPAMLTDYLNEVKGNPRIPGIMALGFMASYSDEMAQVVVDGGAVLPLAVGLSEESEAHIRSVMAWCAGQIGRHSPKHAKAVSDAGILAHLANYEGDASSPDDLRSMCKKSLKAIIGQLEDVQVLDMLVHRNLPESVMGLVLQRTATALASNPQGRMLFVQSGSLALVQQMGEAPDSPLKSVVDAVNANFPDEVVKHYSPSYSQALLMRLEAMNVAN